MKFLLSLVVSIILLLTSISAQVTIIVNSVPDNTPESDPIHVAGNFNDWNPSDTNYVLEKQSDGSFKIEIPVGTGVLKYKFTRGTWESVEGDANGDEISDRTFTYGNGESITVQILSWKDLSENSGGNDGTVTQNVFILSENFFMPQLTRNRRIWIYLPPDYDSSTEAYPVIYMHDGQNLFNKATSFAGEWKVDESMNELINQGATKSIIVGIDNGGSFRIDELTPWVNSRYGGGDGDRYVRFITETLKPFIDENYRTKSNRFNTGIMGSSLGGLISYYAAVQYPETFGMAGVFSPSFWYSNEVFPFTESFENEYSSRFFFLMGEKESNTAVSEMNNVISSLKSTGFPEENIKSVVKADGTHSEWFWAREFPNAYLWMIGDENLITSTTQAYLSEKLRIYPNPASKFIKIEIDSSVSTDPEIVICNMIGTKIQLGQFNLKRTSSNILELDISTLISGYYLLHYSANGIKKTKPLIVK